MKKLLLASFALNLLLIATGGVYLALHKAEKPSPPALSQANTVPGTHALKTTPLEKTQRPPFHWNQVESEDYAVFIANLRGIGCPEQTIHQIISGEVATMYQEKLQLMQSKTGRPALASEIRKIQTEQQGVIASIMHSAAASAPVQSGAMLPVQRPARMPVILQASAPAAGQSPRSPASSSPSAGSASSPTQAQPPLNQGQAVALESIRARFVEDVGGVNQNPSDPEYLKRWTPAQRIADDRMRAYMGVDFYNKFQIEAARQEVEASKK